MLSARLQINNNMAAGFIQRKIFNQLFIGKFSPDIR